MCVCAHVYTHIRWKVLMFEGPFRVKVAKNYGTREPLKNVGKTKVSGLSRPGKKLRPNTVIQKSSKTIGKTSKCAEGPRFGINVAAAPPSRAHVNLQGNPYKTKGKQAFPMGAAYVAPCATVPRLSENTVKRNTL